MDTDKDDQEEEKKIDVPVYQRKSMPINPEIVQSKTIGTHTTELMLSRKAYMAVKDLNNNPELSHIIEAADHTESDQRHHLKIPESLIAMSRHMFSEIVRKINMSIKKGRCKYGEITKKNLIQCVSKLHG